MSDWKKYINVYSFEIVLPGTKEKIEFKPLTTGQMKQILVYEDETDPMSVENALDDLMISSVITPNFNIKNMYLQDRFFLMTEIRKKTRGSYYQFEYECPQCGSQSLQSVNLDELKVKYPPEEIDPIVKINDNISVELDFITRGDQLEAYKYVRNKFGDSLKQMQLVAEVAIVSNAIAIKRVITPEGDEKMSIEDKQYLVENIPREEFDRLDKWFEKNDFGLDFTFKMGCKHLIKGKFCGFEREVNIPTEQFFF